MRSTRWEEKNFELSEGYAGLALVPLPGEVAHPEVWSAERDGAFPAGLAPGRDGLLGKGEDPPIFGIFDGPLTLAVAQRFVSDGG